MRFAQVPNRFSAIAASVAFGFLLFSIPSGPCLPQTPVPPVPAQPGSVENDCSAAEGRRISIGSLFPQVGSVFSEHAALRRLVGLDNVVERLPGPPTVPAGCAVQTTRGLTAKNQPMRLGYFFTGNQVWKSPQQVTRGRTDPCHQIR